eukprot:Unigene12009_Nuclearia_a/m.36537 Unigene12009_Nuclearia_a/g.36537  ORF Unigene12009_Nuclearia_a/g.36537 Unigene12009_Nuclearia_a/m.36537 type:complete len:312 (-) Unigene12009_Nuclearia_a:200-1135(-)
MPDGLLLGRDAVRGVRRDVRNMHGRGGEPVRELLGLARAVPGVVPDGGGGPRGLLPQPSTEPLPAVRHGLRDVHGRRGERVHRLRQRQCAGRYDVCGVVPERQVEQQRRVCCVLDVVRVVQRCGRVELHKLPERVVPVERRVRDGVPERQVCQQCEQHVRRLQRAVCDVHERERVPDVHGIGVLVPEPVLRVVRGDRGHVRGRGDADVRAVQDVREHVPERRHVRLRDGPVPMRCWLERPDVHVLDGVVPDGPRAGRVCGDAVQLAGHVRVRPVRVQRGLLRQRLQLQALRRQLPGLGHERLLGHPGHVRL